MTWQGWFTVAVIMGCFGMLVGTRIATDMVLVGALTILFTVGIVDFGEAFSGFANEGLMTVGVLFIVASALRETGAIGFVIEPILGRPKSIVAAQTRLMLPVAALSGFVNNTPIVAMMIPVVRDWAKKHHFAISRLMIPLSYATVLGGMCTLIGTSTNLVVNGLLVQHDHHEGLSFFEIAPIGIPCAIVGLTYILLVGRRLLADHGASLTDLEDPREYIVEMMVEEASALVGKTIEEAGLRHLPGMFLVEIERGGDVIPAVSPTEKLLGGDRLVFTGIVETVVDLQKIRGLVPATNQVFKLNAPRNLRCLIEAVVSNTCPLVNMTIRDGRFRSVYDAAIIAVTHDGKRVRKKIGDIVLKPGDTLLLEAHPSFVDRHRNSRDFFLVSPISDSTPPRHDRAMFALSILGLMVALAVTGITSMFNAALIAAGLMLLTRCVTGRVARRSIAWEVLVAIGASFGIGKALEVSGAADVIAQTVVGLGAGSPWISLVLIYLITIVFTEIVTNNAAAVLIFPIALATAESLKVDVMPFVIVVMVAASAGFATPMGYQTHLMVYGPGGYRFTDFLKIGIPLDVIVAIVTVVLTPFIWPFSP